MPHLGLMATLLTQRQRPLKDECRIGGPTRVLAIERTYE